MAAALQAQGHEALELAFVTLQPLIGAADRVRLAALAERCDFAVFVSPSAVEILGQALGDVWPAGPVAAVVGPGSQAALADRGFTGALLTPDGPDYDAESLLKAPALQTLTGRQILVVRAAGGNQRIEQTLRERGAEVTVLEAYARRAADPEPAAIACLARWLTEEPASRPILLITTTDAAQRLAGLAEHDPALAAVRQLTAMTIHPRIADCLRNCGWRTVKLIEPGTATLVRTLEWAQDATDSPAS